MQSALADLRVSDMPTNYCNHSLHMYGGLGYPEFCATVQGLPGLRVKRQVLKSTYLYKFRIIRVNVARVSEKISVAEFF